MLSEVPKGWSTLRLGELISEHHDRVADEAGEVQIVEDLIKMLDGIGNDYRHRRHPDSKHATRVAELLRRVADELEL